MANPQAMNSYSYANGNPIINKDPDGRVAGIDDALIFAALTSPEWAPVVYATLGAAAASTAVLLRNNGGGLRFVPNAIRAVQMPRPPSLFPNPGSGPEKTPSNKWLRWGSIAAGTYELAKFDYDIYQNATSKGPDNQKSDTQGQSPQFIGPQSNQSTPALVSPPKSVTYTCGVNIFACSAPQQTQQIKPAYTIDKPTK